MTIHRVALVPGTFGGRKQDWTAPGSPFRRYLESRGFDCVQFLGWSGDVDGVPRLLENGRHADWIAGGWALHYMGALPTIAHSHGGQVAAYCAANTPSLIPALVTICTPVRRDMRDVYAQARLRTGSHAHVYATGWDFLQRAGELFDGQIGWSREMPFADRNVGIDGVGHTGMLENPAYFPLWESLGLLDLLRDATLRDATLGASPSR